jgi:hypothetical protein
MPREANKIGFLLTSYPSAVMYLYVPVALITYAWNLDESMELIKM